MPELDALARVATSFGAESTACVAYDLGFHVVLAVAVGATIGASAWVARMEGLMGPTLATA